MTQEYIFEVRDTTNPETYYTFGVFTSLEAVKEIVEESDLYGDTMSPFTQTDIEQITVFKRTLDILTEEEKEVAKFTREVDLESGDWRTTEST